MGKTLQELFNVKAIEETKFDITLADGEGRVERYRKLEKLIVSLFEKHANNGTPQIISILVSSDVVPIVNLWENFTSSADRFPVVGLHSVGYETIGNVTLSVLSDTRLEDGIVCAQLYSGDYVLIQVEGNKTCWFSENVSIKG